MQTLRCTFWGQSLSGMPREMVQKVENMLCIWEAWVQTLALTRYSQTLLGEAFEHHRVWFLHKVSENLSFFLNLSIPKISMIWGPNFNCNLHISLEHTNIMFSKKVHQISLISKTWDWKRNIFYIAKLREKEFWIPLKTSKAL